MKSNELTERDVEILNELRSKIAAPRKIIEQADVPLYVEPTEYEVVKDLLNSWLVYHDHSRIVPEKLVEITREILNRENS